MIQNILATRFANDVFANLFNHMFVDNIQITAAETVGVENRGNYYDHHGALEDMVQNHLLQVLSMITMDEPASLEAHDIQHEQARLLKRFASHLDRRSFKMLSKVSIMLQKRQKRTEVIFTKTGCNPIPKQRHMLRCVLGLIMRAGAMCQSTFEQENACINGLLKLRLFSSERCMVTFSNLRMCY